jgi:hypothetical protein
MRAWLGLGGCRNRHFEQFVFAQLLLKRQLIVTYEQGTPPYMAIEALLETNPNFIHKPRHDLESILYIILYICTFIQGPGLPSYKLNLPTVFPPLRTWFSNDRTREVGYRKMAHLQLYDIAILPNFAPYWSDFVPFVKDLIVACFPVNARLPSELQYERALTILGKAYSAVEEPSVAKGSEVIERQLGCTKRPNTDSVHRDTKRKKYPP